ncbi:MAG TPA: hypothetical protein VFM87_02860 [Agrococcus sp.]|jgi:hypothetical protein|nr:hypothetical protein [Agrococcus sp.]
MHVLNTIIAMVLFIGGLVLMGYSFDAPGLEVVLFVGGLAVLCFSVYLAIEIGRREHSRSRSR